MAVNRLRRIAIQLLALGACGGVCGACSAGPPGENVGSTRAPAIACAGRDVLPGVDVSEYQGSVDWVRVKSAGCAFAIARVSDGSGHRDPTFAANWSGIKAAGLVRGVYQFFRGGDDPLAQADLLLDAIDDGFGPNDLPPVADVEVTDDVSPEALVSHLATWAERIRSATGRAPMIYTGASFWNGLPDASSFATDALWVADWQVPCPDTPSAWEQWLVWQYADDGNVFGITGAVDLDELSGSFFRDAAAEGRTASADAAVPGGDADAASADASVPDGNADRALLDAPSPTGGDCHVARGPSSFASPPVAAMLLLALRRRRASARGPPWISTR